MALLIDTSVFIDIERQGAPQAVIQESLSTEPLFIAAITASEMLHGVERADSARRRAKRERFVETILRAVPVLAFDLPVAREHARIWADLARQGRLIGAHDLLIAATCIAHEMRLLTANRREFDRVAGLVVEPWIVDPNQGRDS